MTALSIFFGELPVRYSSLVILILVSQMFPPPVGAELRVGVVIPLSGEVQFWGEGIKRGLELFEHHHPEEITFIYEDEGFCNSKMAVTAAKKLLERDKVRFIVTGCLNGTKAIQPIAERQGAVLLSAGLLDESSAANFNNVLSLSAQIGTEAFYMAQYLKSKGFKRVTLFRHDDTFTAEFRNEFEKYLAKGGSVELGDVAVVDQNFPWQSELLKAKRAKSDGYILWLGKDEMHSFLKARAQLRDSTQVLSGYILESNFDADEFGGLLEQIVYTYPVLAELESGERQKFEESFRSLFGQAQRPTVNSYFVYDGMSVLLAGRQNCPKATSAACVVKYFAGGSSEWNGVSGAYRYDQEGRVKRVFSLKQVQGRKFVGLQPDSEASVVAR